MTTINYAYFLAEDFRGSTFVTCYEFPDSQRRMRLALMLLTIILRHRQANRAIESPNHLVFEQICDEGGKTVGIRIAFVQCGIPEDDDEEGEGEADIDEQDVLPGRRPRAEGEPPRPRPQPQRRNRRNNGPVYKELREQLTTIVHELLHAHEHGAYPDAHPCNPLKWFSDIGMWTEYLIPFNNSRDMIKRRHRRPNLADTLVHKKIGFDAIYSLESCPELLEIADPQYFCQDFYCRSTVVFRGKCVVYNVRLSCFFSWLTPGFAVDRLERLSNF